MNNPSLPQRTVPPEIRGWNWGAFGFSVFGLGWLWAWGNGLRRLAIVLLMIFFFHVYLIIAVQGKGFSKPMASVLNLAYIWLGCYLGKNGSSFAWRNRYFSNTADFVTYRRLWGWWAFSLTAFIVGFTLGVFSFFIWLDSHSP